jgi:hypothetical protein
MNAGKLKLTQAVRSLDLPTRLSIRLARALDYGLRNRAGGVETLHRTVTEVALVLHGRCGDSAAVIGQLQDTVIAHLEERGVRITSVLAAAPVPVVFASEMGEVAARALGVHDANDATDRPKAQVARWIARARELRKPPGDDDSR